MKKSSIQKSFLSLFVFFGVFLSTSAIGQNPVTRSTASTAITKLYVKSEKLLRQNKREKAIKCLEKAVSKEPAFIDGILKLGGLKYEDGDYETAINHFESALALDSNYDDRIYQALALTYEKKGDLKKAIHFLSKFSKKQNALNDVQVAELKYKIGLLQFREKSLLNPVPFEPQKLSENINSPNFSEYLPSITADGNTLFFTRVTKNQEDLYYSEKDTAGNWSEPTFMKDVNTYENEGAHCISADGKTILFTACSDGKNGQPRGCNIYISYKKSNSWTPPQYFSKLNSKAWDAQPNISSDGNTIVFASRRKGGFGKSDLWWMKKNMNGQWSEPQNLGDVINTKGSEESPFFHPDGKTLYFKSDYHYGHGSFDIFYSRLNERGEWSKPENIGFPINSKEHEGALIVSLDGKTAYYSKGSGEDNFDKRQSDIYKFDLPIESRANGVGFVKIRIFDKESKEPLSAEIEFQKSNNVNSGISKTQADESGEILITMETGNNYSLNVYMEGYEFHSERFELLSSKELISLELEVALKKISEITSSEPIILRNVLFETASAILLEESLFEVDRLAQLLKMNPDMKIEIRGHTDDVGKDYDNLILSEQRAESVFLYLINQGIDKERMNFKGFGESQPIADNSTEEGKKQNRRTEFIIIR